MTNVKKLGLTALAGSLVATSAYAGALDVTGTAKVTYASLDSTEVTGNPYSMSQGMGFSGSGELDKGYTINYTYSATNMALSSSNLKLDMGDNGNLHFGNGSSATGIQAYYDKMPTAGEQVWDDFDGQANGIAGMSTTNTLGYSNTWSGVGVSLAYNKSAAGTVGHAKSIGLTTADLVDGAEVGYAHADVPGSTNNNGTDCDTVYVTYAAGSVTMGAQLTQIDASAANSDVDRTHVAVSVAVNENLSVSLGQSVVEFEASGKDDQENVGLAFSYTMGSMTIAGFQNSEDNTGGTQGTDDSVTELSVAFAF